MLHGQNDLQFSYECKDGFDSPIYSIIKLRSPKGNICQLFADTVHQYDYSQKNYLKEQGKYVLMINFSSDKYEKDSICYDFEITGNEINVEVSIDFEYKGKYYKEGEYWIKKEKVPQGYIRVYKFYKAPKTIEISLADKMESTDYYKGPFFKLKNNSNDTIYGVHLPGYFWGTLSFMKNDSVIVKRIGMLDYEFVDSPPLYPDSTKISTVGSFGLYKKLPPHKYKYELLFSKKNISQGIGILLDKNAFVWWAGTKDYYQLNYDFEVE
jgi:hypothetical protein